MVQGVSKMYKSVCVALVIHILDYFRRGINTSNVHQQVHDIATKQPAKLLSFLTFEM